MTGEAALYVWGSYFMGLAMVVTELVLLFLRELAIRGQFGRNHDAQTSDGPQDDAAGQDGLAADR